MNASSAPALPGGVTLATPDLDAARAFYAGLLDWTYAAPAGPRTGRAEVTAAYAGGTLAAELEPGAAPARWWTVLAASDAEAVRAAAVGAGARLDGDDVHDPLGGSFRLRAGTDVVAPGTGRPSWYEYMTTAPAGADRFHADALGLRASVPPGAPDDSYALLLAAGRPVAGRLALPPPLAGLLPTGWMAYFAVGDPDDVAGRAQGLGGRLLVPPRDVPTGRVAALTDPAGAVFTVIRPAPAPG
ncbi:MULTISPECIES: VOC family protein [unclassified Micromonospora]|uniref:VOC family protein n=1 Tax=unclassified Micromonospora TaxID=2617518 RepID=UPI00362C1236